jgi:lysophospholipase L1-like esterase
VDRKVHTILKVSLIINFSLLLFIGLLFKLDNFRSVLYEELRKFIGSTQVVLLGDSITARNQSIDWQLSTFSFNTRNLGVDGYTIQQVSQKVNDQVIALSPCLAIIMVGVNRSGNYSVKENISAYQQLLLSLKKQKITPIVIETLLTNRPLKNVYLRELNTALLSFSETEGIAVFPVNKYLMKDGIIDAKYSFDGVHLNEKGYEQFNFHFLSFVKSEYYNSRQECQTLF